MNDDLATMATLKKQTSEVIVINDDSSDYDGEDETPNTWLLLPDAVRKRVFGFLEKKYLLRARRVSKAWCDLASEVAFNGKLIHFQLFATHRSTEAFIKTMLNSSLAKPVVPRLSIQFNLLDFDAKDFINVLLLVAPIVQGLSISFNAVPTSYDGDRLPGIQVRLLLVRLERDQLSFPDLTDLTLTWENPKSNTSLRRSELTPWCWDSMAQLAEKILHGSPKLQSFANFLLTQSLTNLIPIEIRALPGSLKKLHFSTYEQQPCHEDLLQCGFELEEFGMTAPDLKPPNAKQLIAFLRRHKGSLRNLQVLCLERLVAKTYLRFPKLKLVRTLKTNVTCESDMEYLALFPSLVEIYLVHNGSPKTSKETLYPHALEQYQGVRRLHLHSVGSETFLFPVLAHVLPALTHVSFSFTGREMWRKLGDIFACTHFQCLQSLALGFFNTSVSTPTVLESIIAGLTPQTCNRMRKSGDYEVLTENDSRCVGLSALKGLKCFEVSAASREVYDHVFTKITFHHAFLRMEDLKEIRIDTPCQSANKHLFATLRHFSSEFRTKGLELYRMRHGCFDWIDSNSP